MKSYHSKLIVLVFITALFVCSKMPNNEDHGTPSTPIIGLSSDIANIKVSDPNLTITDSFLIWNKGNGLLEFGFLCDTSLVIVWSSSNVSTDSLSSVKCYITIKTDHLVEGNNSILVYITNDKNTNNKDTLNVLVEMKRNHFPYIPKLISPINKSSDIDIPSQLHWNGGDPDSSDTVYYIVSLDTVYPPIRVIDTTFDTSITVSSLMNRTVYYWSIKAFDKCKATGLSTIYSFTTKSNNKSPDVPLYLSPLNSDSIIGSSVNLNWKCSDPENDALIFKVFCDTVNPPKTLITQTANNYCSVPVSLSTKYYWKVIAYDDLDSTSGVIYSFIVKKNNEPPVISANILPVNKALNVKVPLILSWSAFDQNSEPLSYSVFIDTLDNPTKLSAWTSDTFKSIDTLKFNTTYFWRIVVKDQHGGTDSSEIMSFTTARDNHSPNTPQYYAPLNFAAKVDTNVILRWSCIDPDIWDSLTYDIYFDTLNTGSLHLFASNVITSSYQVPSLKRGKTYFWKICAKDKYGLAVFGPIYSFTTRAPNSKPFTPTYINPINNRVNIDSTILISWLGGDPDSDIVKYKLTFDTRYPPANVITDTLLNTNYTISGLIKSTDYFWSITAIDPSGLESNGPVWKFTTKNSIPQFESNTTPSNLAMNIDTSVTLHWTCNDPDLNDTLHYKLYFGMRNNPMAIIANEITNNSFKLPKLYYGTTYDWKLVATDNHKDSSVSSVWSFSTIQKNNPPNKPVLLFPTNQVSLTTDTIIFKWRGNDPDKDDIISFTLNLDTIFPPVKTYYLASDTTFTLNTLKRNTKYYWTITAMDSEGDTSVSSVWQFTTNSVGYKTTLNACGDDLIEVYLNGSRVYFPKGSVSYGQGVDTTAVPVILQSGENVLAVKFTNSAWGGFFAASLVTPFGDTIRTDSTWSFSYANDINWTSINFDEKNWITPHSYNNLTQIRNFEFWGMRLADLYYQKAKPLYFPTKNYYRKTFTNSAAQAATIKLRGKAFKYSVYLNGTLLKTGSEFFNSDAASVPATSIGCNLLAGKNTIAVEIEGLYDENDNVATKFGLFQQGVANPIYSDTSWRISSYYFPDWVGNSFNDDNWVKTGTVDIYDTQMNSYDGLSRAKWICPTKGYFRKKFVLP